jgi:hypothetical protein
MGVRSFVALFIFTAALFATDSEACTCQAPTSPSGPNIERAARVAAPMLQAS